MCDSLLDFEPNRKDVRLHWAASKVALNLVASPRTNLSKYFGGLNPFGNRGVAQLMNEADDRSDNCRIARAG